MIVDVVSLMLCSSAGWASCYPLCSPASELGPIKRNLRYSFPHKKTEKLQKYLHGLILAAHDSEATKPGEHDRYIINPARITVGNVSRSFVIVELCFKLKCFSWTPAAPFQAPVSLLFDHHGLQHHLSNTSDDQFHNH